MIARNVYPPPVNMVELKRVLLLNRLKNVPTKCSMNQNKLSGDLINFLYGISLSHFVLFIFGQHATHI